MNSPRDTSAPRTGSALLAGAAALAVLLGQPRAARAQVYAYSVLRTSNYSVTGGALGAVSPAAATSAVLLGAPSGSAAHAATQDPLQSYVGPAGGSPRRTRSRPRA